MSDSAQQILWLIPAAPLAATIVIALLGPKLLREKSHWPCWLAIAFSAVCSLYLLSVLVPQGFVSQPAAPTVAVGYQWIDVGGLNLRIDLTADAITAIMLSMVTCVSLLVSIFASGYMHGDGGYPRFFAEFSLFVFSMCMLVLASSFLVMYVFWEGVGLCSYLLVGFWFRKPSAAAAAQKAFVVNRIGDFGFILGSLLIWKTFGSVNFADVLGRPELLATISPERITTICLLLFLGAIGKSAQFPLHVWLPDAMEGPTPVSALIHAATMVTAGVYLVARCTPLFVLSPTAQMTCLWSWGDHGGVGGGDCADADGFETRAGVFDGEPIGVHVHGAGGGRGGGRTDNAGRDSGHVSFVYACVFQSATVLGGRQRDALDG